MSAGEFNVRYRPPGGPAKQNLGLRGIIDEKKWEFHRLDNGIVFGDHADGSDSILLFEQRGYSASDAERLIRAMATDVEWFHVDQRVEANFYI